MFPSVVDSFNSFLVADISDIVKIGNEELNIFLFWILTFNLKVPVL